MVAQEGRSPRFAELDRLISIGLGDVLTLEGCMLLDKLEDEWKRDEGTDSLAELPEDW